MLRTLTVAAAAALAAGCAHAQTAPGPRGAIERFAADFASDPFLDRDISFGVEIEGAWWTVTATPGANGAPGRVVVTDGRPAAPTFYYTLDAATLAALDTGRMNALTAMARAQQNDPTPMDLEFMDGFQPPDANFISFAIPLIFHFWTRGTPEVIPFNGDVTRVTHGANAAIFYYQPGFRSGFFQVRPGQHVNAVASEQSNPFPSLMIMTRGRINARIGGRDLILNEGEAVFIPASVTHEFTNSFDLPGEGILLMFGEGA